MVATAIQTDTPASFKRWLRHALYMPWQTKRRINAQAHAHIEAAVTQAEAGHAGEIMVIIEGNLPLSDAYQSGTVERALALFGECRIWDTAYNSGLLLYINVCEQRVELLADRGIHQYVDQTHWIAICEAITHQIQAGEWANGIVAGVQQMGETLQSFYQQQAPYASNELADKPMLL